MAQSERRDDGEQETGCSREKREGGQNVAHASAEREERVQANVADHGRPEDQEDPTFQEDLVQALVTTGATLAFDATGGGKLAGQILTGMEIAANKSAEGHSIYGSTTFKQVYIYGGLDRTPTVLNRSFGLAWSLGGWLLTYFIQKISPEAFAALRQRVADEITTTFDSHYTKEISLVDVLSEDAIKAYSKQATGEKFLIKPHQ